MISVKSYFNLGRNRKPRHPWRRQDVLGSKWERPPPGGDGCPVLNKVPATRAAEVCRIYDETLETFEMVMKLETHLNPTLAEQAADERNAEDE